jgi:hypothetical protein
MLGNTTMLRSATTLAIALLAGGALAQQPPSQQRPTASAAGRLEINQVPPNILAAARSAGDLTEITQAGIEVEGARIIYEITGRTREGQVREVDFHADGQLEEIETEIQQTDVPQPVMQALQRWMPNFRPTRIERSDRPAVSGVTYAIYEFEGQHGGVEVDVEAFPDGSRIMTVDDSRN